MDTIAFLDLEETLISDWSSFLPVNVDKVNRWLATLPKDTRFGLFSWAVWNDKDLERFRSLEWELTEVFGIIFEPEFKLTLSDMRQVIQRRLKWIDLDQDDFFAFFNKERGFLEFARQDCFNGKHLLLLDDTVQNISVTLHDTGTKVDFVDVRKLP